MLVLDRKIQEGFWIDGGIFIKVLEIGRHRVKLGIEAPADLQILRQELRSRANGNESLERDLGIDKREERTSGSTRQARRRS